jgi:hypothetical protein
MERYNSIITQISFTLFHFFLGYSSTENSWEPENNVINCQDLIKEFEAEEAKKNQSKTSNSNAPQLRTRKSQISTRSSSSPLKKSTNTNERSTRSSNRPSSNRKRTPSDGSIFTDDGDEDDDDEDDNGYIEKKLIKSLSSKRLRKNTSDTDTDTTPSIDGDDSDILDTTKLDHILDVRRDKKTNTIEYYIQTKKIKKPVWIKSSRLTEDYTQQVIDFLEEKYV